MRSRKPKPRPYPAAFACEQGLKQHPFHGRASAVCVSSSPVPVSQQRASTTPNLRPTSRPSHHALAPPPLTSPPILDPERPAASTNNAIRFASRARPALRAPPPTLAQSHARPSLANSAPLPVLTRICPHAARAHMSHCAPASHMHDNATAAIPLCASHPPKSSSRAPGYGRIPHTAHPSSLVPAYTHPRPLPRVPPSRERERPVGMRAGGSERGARAIAMESPSPHCCTPYLSPLHPLLPHRLAVAPAVPPSPRPSPAHARTPAAPASLDVSPANAPSHLYRYKPNRYYSRLVRDLGRDWT
ncbi:hypothetical protein DFH09DRAFT_1419403 [Mycena vulgaris]|nr:hypothetical protein DFH09DRAFT_1419403 [Mycena vulgaris]